MALRPLRKAYRFWLIMKYAYPNTRTHTQTNIALNQTSTKDSPEWLRLSPVAAAPWSIPWPTGHAAGRARSAADANGWSRRVDGTSNTSTIGKAGRFLHSWRVGKVGNWKWYLPQFLGGYRSFRRLQCSMSGGNKSILPVWVRIRYPKLLSLLQDRPNLAVVYLHLSKPLWVPKLDQKIGII